MLREFRSVLLAGLLTALAACASGSGESGPGETRGGIPDLRGRRVLVLPTQLRDEAATGATIDEEIAFALPARSERVSWVFPPEAEQILRRSPGIEANLWNLPVGVFLQAEVRRIGDPLHGDIRRLAALVNADLAVIPVQLTYGADEAYHLMVTIVDPIGAWVLFVTTVSGEAGSPGEAMPLASLADSLSRILVPLG